MGLHISHDAFSGAYSSFNRLRVIIAKAMGGSYPPHENERLDDEKWYWGHGFNDTSNPGLLEFFNHSDCDGEIDPDTCTHLANELECLLPQIEKQGIASGHLARNGGYVAVTNRLIKGCRQAASKGAALIFQ